MSRLFAYFLRGLVFVAPLGITLYICWLIFTRIDGWLGIPIPGVGFLVTIALITIFGFLASNLITRGALGVFDSVMNRLPFVRLLYSSTKDLLNAFVGEKRRFDKPVLVRIYPGGEARALGFVTQESLTQLGLDGFVSVYFPQSYNFAGSLILYPVTLVEPIDASSSEVMAFIVSGGVTDVPLLGGRGPGARTPARTRSVTH
jgi:uncharacterized membrane protein